MPKKPIFYIVPMILSSLARTGINNGKLDSSRIGLLSSELRALDCRNFSHRHNHEKTNYLIERTFQREKSLYLACSDVNAFFASEERRTRDTRNAALGKGVLICKWLWRFCSNKTKLMN